MRERRSRVCEEAPGFHPGTVPWEEAMDWPGPGPCRTRRASRARVAAPAATRGLHSSTSHLNLSRFRLCNHTIDPTQGLTLS